MRPSGIVLINMSITLSGTLSTNGVSMKPGITAFTRMPCLANSFAADFVSPKTPALDAE